MTAAADIHEIGWKLILPASRAFLYRSAPPIFSEKHKLSRQFFPTKSENGSRLFAVERTPGSTNILFSEDVGHFWRLRT